VRAPTRVWQAISPYSPIIIIVVASMSAHYAYQNYVLQLSINRPQLIFSRVTLVGPSKETAVLEVEIRNVGTKPALPQTIVVRTADLRNRQVKGLA